MQILDNRIQNYKMSNDIYPLRITGNCMTAPSFTGMGVHERLQLLHASLSVIASSIRFNQTTSLRIVESGRHSDI